MIKAVDLKRGRVISYDNDLFSVHSVQIMAKGNWRSYIQAKLRSLKSGRLIDARFATDDKIETPFVDTKPYEFLYKEGTDFVLMDTASFDQIHVSAEVMAEAEMYLKGNETIVCQMINGQIVSVELPNTVELKVTDTAPVSRGATVTNQTKDAELETGLRIRVPPFIENGEMVRVDTRTGEYLERAKG